MTLYDKVTGSSCNNESDLVRPSMKVAAIHETFICSA